MGHLTAPQQAGGALGHSSKGEVPEGHYTVPIGKAEVCAAAPRSLSSRMGTLVHVALATAEKLDIDAEVIICAPSCRSTSTPCRIGQKDRPLRDRA